MRLFGKAVQFCTLLTVKCVSNEFAELVVTVGMMSVRPYIASFLLFISPFVQNILVVSPLPVCSGWIVHFPNLGVKNILKSLAQVIF